MAQLEGLQVFQEDVFFESAKMLDFLICKSDINQHQVDSLWTLLLNDIRLWKADVSLRDKQIVAGTVFMLVRATLIQHYETRYCETLPDMLTTTIERELSNRDEKEEQEMEQFLERLNECSPMLSEWIIRYENEEKYLSDQIEETLSKKSGNDEEFKPSGKTFSKTSLLTDTLIDIIGQRLTKANKLSASPDDWRKLFSGIDQQFTLTWLGSEGELRDLFKMLTGEPQYAKPNHGYQKIIRSHFVDNDDQRFNNLHGAKSIDSFYPILDDCLFLLQHMTENVTEIMKQLINDNRNALNDMGYFDKIQSAKQAGMRIQNKRR